MLEVIDNLSTEDRNLNRQAILKYEEFAKKQPQVDIPVIHRIHGGMYTREITIPKGVMLTGQIYKFDHLDVMISGDITVSTDDGERKRFKGYNVFKGLSGKKRAGIAHEDTTWITVHPFTGNDGEEIQKLITAENFEELNEFYAEFARFDYFNTFHDSLELIESQSKNESDLCDYELEQLSIKESPINGLGVFANIRFKAGDFVAKARVGDSRTVYGKTTNHSPINNCDIDENLNIIANRPIEIGDEITMNYKQVINNRLKSGDLCQA